MYSKWQFKFFSYSLKIPFNYKCPMQVLTNFKMKNLKDIEEEIEDIEEDIEEEKT